jgi:hypothetical protein
MSNNSSEFDLNTLWGAITKSMLVSIGIVAVPAILEVVGFEAPSLKLPEQVFVIIYGLLACGALTLLFFLGIELRDYLSPQYQFAQAEHVFLWLFGRPTTDADKRMWSERMNALKHRSRRFKLLRSVFEGDSLGESIGGALAALVVLSVAFSQFCRYLTNLEGGFVSGQSGYWHWLRFGPATLFDNTLFGVSEIFAWNFTDIRPIALWSQFLVLAYNAVLQLTAIAAAIGTIRLLEKVDEEMDDETRSPTYTRVLTDGIRAFVASLPWIALLSVAIGAAARDHFSALIAIGGVLYFVPLTWFIWISGTNLVAFRTLHGCRNKLIALGGVTISLVGAAVFMTYVPTIFDLRPW